MYHSCDASSGPRDRNTRKLYVYYIGATCRGGGYHQTVRRSLNHAGVELSSGFAMGASLGGAADPRRVGVSVCGETSHYVVDR